MSINSPTTVFTDQEHAEDLIKELIEDGHDKEDMEEFIKTHGHKDFVLYYEDYTRMVEELSLIHISEPTRLR